MLPTVSPATQAPGGLLVAGELPGAPVIGELVPRRDSVLIIRYAGPVRTWRPRRGELLTMPSGTE